MKICVIIPALNEEKKISGLVKAVKSYGLFVLVIDDGSTDSTKQSAEESGAEVIRNSPNIGKGASLIIGFNYALKNGFDAVITMDGDGQHLPGEIPSFISSAESNADILVGNRMVGCKNMPFVRLLTNRFMSWLISIIAKQQIPDTQCGYRLIKRTVLERVKFDTLRYETESEILIKAARLGYKIQSVPIKTVYSDEKSRINPFIDTLRFIKLIIRQLWMTRH